MTTMLLDRRYIAEIRFIGDAAGCGDVLPGFICKLERSLAAFGAALSEYAARGDSVAAERAAHTLKGTCRQLGAHALGDVFADIEDSAKAGDYAEAKHKFHAAADLIAQSLEALKRV